MHTVCIRFKIRPALLHIRDFIDNEIKAISHRRYFLIGICFLTREVSILKGSE
jgi:hypothetical protein